MTLIEDLGMRVAREIRAHREARGLSLSATAGRAGISKTILAQIESGAGNPSLETLCRIAQALDVTVQALVADDRDPVSAEVIPREGAEWFAFESGLRGRLIHVDGRDRRVEMLEIRLEPGRRYHSAAHQPGTEELIVSLEGAMSAGPEGHEETLSEGDAVRFAADLPHRYVSEEGGLALCCFSYPPARRGSVA